MAKRRQRKLSMARSDWLTQAVKCYRAASQPSDFHEVTSLLNRFDEDARRAIRRVLPLSISNDDCERGVAAELIGMLGQRYLMCHEWAVGALLEMAKTETDVDVQLTMVDAFGTLRDQRALGFVTDMAASSDSDVRHMVAQVLLDVTGAGQFEASVAVLRRLMNDENEGVREKARLAMGNIE